MMSHSLGWRISWIKLIVNSTIKIHEGWIVLSIDVHWPTQMECSSARWSSGTMMMWEWCSRYLVSTVLKNQSSWTFLWSDLLEIFEKVWSNLGTMKKSGLWLRNQTKKLIWLTSDLLCFVLLHVLSCWIISFDVFEIVIFNVGH